MHYHIYPKAYLATQGIPFHEANVISNIRMLTSADNNEISDGNPADYFQKIPPKIRDDVFERALVSADFRDGSKAYADFVKERAALLAAQASYLIQQG